MRWQEFRHIVQDEPLIETALLLTGSVTRHQAQRQLTDWTSAGKIIQLRRGLYTLPQRNPHPFVVANRLVAGSYVSLQMALAYHHLIPEHVAAITSVTTERPVSYQNKFGRFSYRHIQPTLFFGMEYRLLVGDEYAFVATPEKALLDLIHLRPGGDSRAYIDSLRLQNLEILDLERLLGFAERTGKPKLMRAADIIATLVQQELSEYETL
ncbi:MAG: hypothetical protein KDE59_30995 [Anaerolineales bacterium]|nr:hypothetical protein [Anaerolineales bacterium]